MRESTPDPNPKFPETFFRTAVVLGAVLVSVVIGVAVFGRAENRPGLLYELTVFGPMRNFTRGIWVALAAVLAGRIALAALPHCRLRASETPHAIGAALLVGSLMLFDAQIREDSAAITEASVGQARAIGKQLLMTIDDPTLALERMAERWSRRGGIAEQEWRGDVRRLLTHFPGLYIYARLDAEGVIRWIYPDSDAARYVGLNVYAGPSRGVSFDRARTTNALAFTKVSRLRFGVTGFGAFAPIWIGDTFAGALSFGIDIERFFRTAIDPGGYRAEFRESGSQPFFVVGGDANSVALDRERFSKWRGSDRVEFRNLLWTIETFPTEATVARYTSKLPIVLLSAGLMLAVLCGALVELTLSARRARALAREALTWQKAIVDASDFPIVSTDAAGIVRSFNPAAERLLGYWASEVCDRATPALWHDDEEVRERAAVLSERLGRTIEAGFPALVEGARLGEVDRREWTFVTKGGARRSVLSTVHILDETRNSVGGYVWIVEDLTIKKDQARKIAEQQTQIVNSSRLAAVGEMAAGVAHEINNPLLVIAGKVEQVRRLGERAPLDPSLVMKNMDSIRATVERIAKIVTGLRSFARDSSGEPLESASVRGIVEETVALCAERFRNHSIELEVVPFADFRIRCRPYQIAQVLLNLLNNAFDAASVGADSARWVRLEARVEGTAAEFVVTDSGGGVSAAHRDKIMMPFFTTKEVGKGTGLGLSISQGIMAEHAGSLMLDADSAHTRFVARMPAEES